MARAVGELTGESAPPRAWGRLFRYLNAARGRGDAGYKPGEKILIKPNWVGMIWREGAVAENPPPGTFYDPDHPAPEKRLARLGVHEHWNNPKEKKYSRNLGSGKGIELVAVGPA